MENNWSNSHLATIPNFREWTEIIKLEIKFSHQRGVP